MWTLYLSMPPGEFNAWRVAPTEPLQIALLDRDLFHPIPHFHRTTGNLTMSDSKVYCILFDRRYLLLDQIGEGFQAQVFLVRDLQTGELFVRKLTKQSDDREQAAAQSELTLWKPGSHVTQLVNRTPTIYSYPPTSPNTVPKRHFASIWKYCNGGTLWDLICGLQWMNNTDETSKKVPEILVWAFFEAMVDAQLGLLQDQPFVRHGDSHNNNWFIHWPDPNTPLAPTIKLGDFGFAEEWPAARDQNHRARKPWSDSQEITPGPTSTPSNLIRRWYNDVRRDLLSTSRCLMELMCDPLVKNDRPVLLAEDLVKEAYHRRQGLHGYSSDLVQKAWHLHQLGTDTFSRYAHNGLGPMNILRDLIYLRRQISAYSLSARMSHIPNNPEDFTLLEMLPDPPRTSFAYWHDWRQLMPSLETKVTQRDTFRSRNDDLFLGTLPENLADLYDLVLEPEEERAGGLTERVQLRNTEYEVVEAWRDDRGKWYVGRKIPLRWTRHDYRPPTQSQSQRQGEDRDRHQRRH